MTTPSTLIVDYGGVLTSSLSGTMSAWCEGDDVDPAEFSLVMREWLGEPVGAQAALNPVHALEIGAMSVPDFQAELAARLRTRSGDPVVAEGLLERMFAGFDREPSMIEAVRRAKLAGLKTGLLSNSWGLGYPREGWEELFDDTVISGEVGIRKPDPRIYALAADRLGVQPAECVFVDDLGPNIRAAVEGGMIGVLHKDAMTTIGELEAIFGVPLRP